MIVIPLLVIVPSSLTYPMPYAWFLASCSIFLLYSCSCSMTLCSPLLLLSASCSLSESLSPPLLLFYVVCFPIEPWDGLPGYVHPGIACLAF